MATAHSKSLTDIGSSHDADAELERYGIWVKAEPQDIFEEPDAEHAVDAVGETAQAEDLDSGDLFLSEEEEKLLGSLDEGTTASLDVEVAEPAAEAPTLSDDFDLIVEDLESGSPERQSDLVIEDDSVIDLHIDDMGETAEKLEAKPRTVVSDVKAAPHAVSEELSPADFGVDMSDVEETSSSGSSELESVDLSDFGLSEEPERQTKTEANDGFEPIDIDLSFDDSIPEPTGSGSIHETSAPVSGDYETVSEFDDILSDIESSSGEESAEAPAPKPEAPAAPQARSAAPSSKPAAVARKTEETASGGASSELLLTIVNELSTIKSELVSLKSELSSIRERGPEPASAESESEPAPAGFFDEEEDETIALTGDELDNILNTANFTEETLEAESPSESLLAETGLSGEALLPEDGVYRTTAGTEAPIEEIVLDDKAGKSPKAADDDVFSQLVEEGVKPLTPAPEDTSFLDRKAKDEFQLNIADEVPLVEPDLSNLDLEDVGVGEAEDLTLDVDHVEAPEDLDLLEVSDAVPEIEFERPGDIAMPSLSGGEPEELIELDAGDLEEEASSEIVLHEEALPEVAAAESAFPETLTDEIEELTLEEEPSETERKPSEPVSLHPDDLPLNLSDELFVSPKAPTAAPARPTREPAVPAEEAKRPDGSDRLRSEIKSVLSYLDTLLESLPENKIEEFANSKYFETYKKLFEELGLV